MISYATCEGYMKYKHGVSTVLVEKVWLEDANCFAIKKQLKTWNKYKREKDFYQSVGKDLVFVPNLLKFNDESKTIWTKFCGISLNLKYIPKDRYQFKHRIKEMVAILASLNLYHNDVRWKNVVESDSGELFFIDFESLSEINKERDPENILGLREAT